MVKIKVLFIFEMLGKPPEHLKETLNKMIDSLGKQKGLSIVRREVHEPKLIEESEEASSKLEKAERDHYIKQGIYSTFSEVEIETEELNLVMAVVLNMLPAHVEILEPSELALTNSNMSGLMSELTVKMHKYDEVTKVLMLEKDHLLRKLKEMEEKVKNFEEEIVNKAKMNDKNIETRKEEGEREKDK